MIILAIKLWKYSSHVIDNKREIIVFPFDYYWYYIMIIAAYFHYIALYARKTLPYKWIRHANATSTNLMTKKCLSLWHFWRSFSKCPTIWHNIWKKNIIIGFSFLLFHIYIYIRYARARANMDILPYTSLDDNADWFSSFNIFTEGFISHILTLFIHNIIELSSFYWLLFSILS